METNAADFLVTHRIQILYLETIRFSVVWWFPKWTGMNFSCCSCPLSRNSLDCCVTFYYMRFILRATIVCIVCGYQPRPMGQKSLETIRECMRKIGEYMNLGGHFLSTAEQLYWYANWPEVDCSIIRGLSLGMLVGKGERNCSNKWTHAWIWMIKEKLVCLKPINIFMHVNGGQWLLDERHLLRNHKNTSTLRNWSTHTHTYKSNSCSYSWWTCLISPLCPTRSYSIQYKLIAHHWILCWTNENYLTSFSH